jgi:hypothetical protein
MRLGIPYIDVSTALYLDYWGYTPLGIYDWPHKIAIEALIRNQEGIAKAVKLTYNERTKAYFKRIVGATPGQFRASAKLDLKRSQLPGSSRLNRP